MKKIIHCLLLVGILACVQPIHSTVSVSHTIESVETVHELGIDPELINQAFPDPIVAEKPSFIQRQLARIGLPVYFALRASKNYIVHAWHKIRS